MMKAKRLFAGAAVGLALLGMLACEMGGTEADAGPEGKAAVRIEVAGAGETARTVLPAVSLTDAVSWEVWGVKAPAAGTSLGTFSSLDELKTGLHLDPGTWDFTLKGYNSAEGLILRGTIAGQEIKLEQTNTLSFRVAPVKEDNGRFKISVTLPGGSGITRADVSIAGGPVTEGVTLEGGKVVFENGSYPAGDHYFTIKLYKGDDLCGVVSDVVQVRNNLSSEKEYALELKDLNAAYAINYHLGYAGGVMASGSYRSTDKDYSLPAPAREGYTFGAWYGKPLNEGGDPPVPVSVISQGSEGDKDFYARWEVIEYTIAYVLDGGTNAAGNPATYTIESDEITLADPVYSTNVFDGWYEDSERSIEAATTIPAKSTGDKAFYAKWKSPVDIGVDPLPGDLSPGISPKNPSLTKGTIQEFSVIIPDGAAYTACEWYLNGVSVGTGSTYTLADKDSGVYALTVKVTTGAGDTLSSAICQVTINE